MNRSFFLSSRTSCRSAPDSGCPQACATPAAGELSSNGYGSGSGRAGKSKPTTQPWLECAPCLSTGHLSLALLPEDSALKTKGRHSADPLLSPAPASAATHGVAAAEGTTAAKASHRRMMPAAHRGTMHMPAAHRAPVPAAVRPEQSAIPRPTEGPEDPHDNHQSQHFHALLSAGPVEHQPHPRLMDQSYHN